MFSAFANSLKIPELRSRIFYTLALLFVARVGAHIPLPGLDPRPLRPFLPTKSPVLVALWWVSITCSLAVLS